MPRKDTIKGRMTGAPRKVRRVLLRIEVDLEDRVYLDTKGTSLPDLKERARKDVLKQLKAHPELIEAVVLSDGEV